MSYIAAVSQLPPAPCSVLRLSARIKQTKTNTNTTTASKDCKATIYIVAEPLGEHKLKRPPRCNRVFYFTTLKFNIVALVDRAGSTRI